MFSIIAAIGKNRELGKDNQLLFRLKEDMKFFRDTTKGHKTIMGHKTWDSLPKKLPGRENIVIARKPVDGADLTITNLTEYISNNTNSPEEIFVIGGGMVYFELLKYAKNLYLTEVDASVPDADTFFPEFDKTNYTKEIIKKGSQDGLNYTFAKYTRNI